jgi:tyrosine-protein kinase Etk/Wzc
MDREIEQQTSLNDYLRILHRGRWIIAISFIVVLAVTVIYTFTTKPVYEAGTMVMVEANGAMERSLFGFGALGNQSTLIMNQIEILKSRTLSERVIKRLDLSDIRDSLAIFQPNEEGEFTSSRDMVEMIRESMEITHKKDTDILQITFAAGSAFEAAYIATTVAEEFRDYSAESSNSEISDLRLFVENQQKKKEQELKLSEERLRDYQEQERVASLDEETTDLVTSLSEYEAKLEAARIELRANLELKKSFEEQLNERKQTLSTDLSEISTPYLISLQEQLAQAVAERTKYVTAIETEVEEANKQHFQMGVKQYDDRITALKEKLTEEAQKITASSMVSDPFQVSQELITKLFKVDAEIKAGTATINALQGILDQYNGKLEALPEKVLELARLERQRMVDEQTYIMMTQKLEETKIQAAAQTNTVTIIDKAIEPLKPVKPKKKLNVLLGAILGIGLGVGITFLLEYFDNTIKSHEELEQMGFNILASIPKIQMDQYEKKIETKLEKLGPIDGKKNEARLITHLDPKSPVSESYRTLRTNLQFSKIDRDLKTILITSSAPKEGKSTTAANLAIAMAQVGRKVVLIDGDLRRPVAHSIFGIDKEEGITNCLMNKLPYEELAKNTFIENLKIITSGILPPNPSELLASEKMENLLKRLKEDFDLVIIDSPPVIAVTDAAILSTKVDGTLLVISSGQTDREALNRAKALLENVETNLLGVLFNNVDIEGQYDSYYYYYHQHYSKRRKKINTV